MNPAFVTFVARRLVAAALFVLVVSTSAFALARLAPGDETTADVLAGVDPAVIAARRAELGLDDPVLVQTGRWLAGLARFDFGESAHYRRPVRALVVERGLNTATLAFTALVLSLGVGVPLGILTGAHPRRVISRLVTMVSLVLVACPPLVGALLLVCLAVSTGVLSIAPGALALPALALSLPLCAMIERLQSQATGEALQDRSVSAAAARGIPAGRRIWRHAARLSSRPVVGVLGLLLGSLFSGSLAVELVAAWPGLGRLMYDGVLSGDVALVAGCVWAGAVCLAVGNLVGDIVGAWLDPRVMERHA